MIGSSIARVCRREGLVGEMTGIVARPQTQERLRQLGIVDHVCTDIKEAVSAADLVILCTPLSAYKQVAEQMAPYLARDCIVSDVGSVKGRVVETLSQALPAQVHIIPAHPIAGIEKSGAEAGLADLFLNRWCIMTPPQGVAPWALERLTAFWEGCGSLVMTMAEDQHDRFLALTSHLPHLVSYAMVLTAIEGDKVSLEDISRFSAGGFRDFSRIAASPPRMWRDIFLSNRAQTLDALARFQKQLDRLADMIKMGDGEGLEENLGYARSLRQQILKAGQAGHFDPREDFPQKEKDLNLKEGRFSQEEKASET